MCLFVHMGHMISFVVSSNPTKGVDAVPQNELPGNQTTKGWFASKVYTYWILLVNLIGRRQVWGVVFIHWKDKIYFLYYHAIYETPT